MKLCRIGNLGKEKPAVIDDDGNYRDVSEIIYDFDPSTLTFETIKKLSDTNIKNFPIISKNERIGACVNNPKNF